jgi:hypothetical protein
MKGRITVHSTRYSSYTDCRCGRGWIELDGREIAGLNTAEAWHPASPYAGRGPITESERIPGHLHEKAEFTRFDLHDACWEYVHSNAHASLSSAAPLLRGLAVLHGKVGRNRLESHLASETHPLVRHLAEMRLQAEIKPD